MLLAIHLWLVAVGAQAIVDRVAMNVACIGCHPIQAAQWEGSEHATAYTDAPFQAALLREPQAFCRACHAPEQDARLSAITPASSIGVGCVGCHLDPVATPGADGRHLSMRAAVDCDGCHEFGFPDDALRAHPLAMQRTVSEHRSSPFGDQGCASCHLPRDAAGLHDHRIAVTRDPDTLARALAIAAERVGPSRIRVRLAVVGAGHAVPTGDLFRRLEIGAMAIDPHDPQRPARRWLGRRFATRVEPTGIEVIAEVADDRVHADAPRELVLEVPGADGRDVVWWVSHQRVAFPRGDDPAAAVLDGETPIGGGVLVHGGGSHFRARADHARRDRDRDR